MSIEELVNKYYSHMNSNDLHIWKYISNHKKECVDITIEELANRCNVSRTTILRFAKKLSFKGFTEMKMYLKWQDNKNIEMESRAFSIICEGYIHAIEDIKKKNFTRASELIYDAGRVFVYGSGDIQRAVGKQLKRMFLTCQEIIYDFEGLTFDRSFYSAVNESDVMILISLSGENENIIDIARKLRNQNVKIISITKLKDNSLARLSDECIYVSTSQIVFDDAHPTFESTTIYFVLAELFFVSYTEYCKMRRREGCETSHIL